MAQQPDLDNGVAGAWPVGVSMNEVGRSGLDRRFIAEGPALVHIATALDLQALKSLQAKLNVSPWLDGVQITGRWSAVVEQICGVTLDPFESALAGELDLRLVPPGSAALGTTPDHELELDPEADDPPDLLDGDFIPLGAYVVEDLSLAIDPFPRKPGAEFEAPAGPAEPSPFAVLARLKDRQP